MTPDVSLPTLVIPADTAADLTRTVECSGQCDPWTGALRHDETCPVQDGHVGRVPDPEAPRRLVLDERPVVPCPNEFCNGGFDDSGPITEDCRSCSDETPGVVPLVGGETVALAVRCDACEGNWRWDEPVTLGDGTRTTFDTTCEHCTNGQVPVAVAQVADVIPVFSWAHTPDMATTPRYVLVTPRASYLFDWSDFLAGTSGTARSEPLTDGLDYTPGGVVVVLGRVDPCEEEEPRG